MQHSVHSESFGWLKCCMPIAVVPSLMYGPNVVSHLRCYLFVEMLMRHPWEIIYMHTGFWWGKKTRGKRPLVRSKHRWDDIYIGL